ncbi:MAG: hypothetical protein RRB22_01630 [Gammaproteobacteria bacterium]|nr:hypothetical protein [Gammaproteobacteria bacterium]
MSIPYQGQEHSAGGAERRMFPRIVASCPVRYAHRPGLAHEHFAEGHWENADLCDYSATGVRMVCDNTLLQDTKINLELLPGTMRRVPRIVAEAVVVRCGLRDDHRYEIACKLTRVRPSKQNSRG